MIRGIVELDITAVLRESCLPLLSTCTCSRVLRPTNHLLAQSSTRYNLDQLPFHSSKVSKNHNTKHGQVQHFRHAAQRQARLHGLLHRPAQERKNQKPPPQATPSSSRHVSSDSPLTCWAFPGPPPHRTSSARAAPTARTTCTSQATRRPSSCARRPCTRGSSPWQIRAAPGSPSGSASTSTALAPMRPRSWARFLLMSSRLWRRNTISDTYREWTQICSGRREETKETSMVWSRCYRGGGTGGASSSSKGPVHVEAES